MAHEAAHKPKPPARRSMTLPPQIVSPADVNRLVNELNLIDESLLQLGIRSGGTTVKMPKTSRLMDLTTEHNKLNLLRKEDRSLLIRYLELVQQKAPRLHFSFGADPSPAFLEKLIAYLRAEIHPHVLVTVGLQPGIGAGCIVRSTNQQFDFSLGKSFVHKQELLQQLTAA